MSDTVTAINLLHAADNAAAVEERIGQLISTYFGSPDWQRMGPNFMRNISSGEVVNLNQEAVKSLQAEGPRADAVAIVQDDKGTDRSVFIPQDAVQAAGGSLLTVAQKLQRVLDEDAAALKKGLPLWAWGVGVLGVGYMIFHRPRPRVAYARHR